MKIIKSREDLKISIDRTKSLGFVATMGALHKGHGHLIESSKNENEKTILSIFVNPTQFNDPKDLELYPRPLEKDLQFCKDNGVDYVFLPSVEEMYFSGQESIGLVESEITKDFEGAKRKGHFEGVLLVVLKLLNMIKPDVAYFGKKDYQQYLLISRMAQNFFLDTKIKGVEVYRESSGLPFSSRNQRLSQEAYEKAREIAKAFHKTETKEDFLSLVSPDLDYYGELYGRVLMTHSLEGIRILDNKEL